jgi:hypothetical protein
MIDPTSEIVLHVLTKVCPAIVSVVTGSYAHKGCHNVHISQTLHLPYCYHLPHILHVALHSPTVASTSFTICTIRPTVTTLLYCRHLP